MCDGGLCRPPCATNDECALTESCARGQCTNPCSSDAACGLNAECQMVRHEKRCACPPGYTGTPEVECVRIPVVCQSSLDCGRGYSCQENVCMGACSSDADCALNEKCAEGSCMCK